MADLASALASDYLHLHCLHCFDPHNCARLLTGDVVICMRPVDPAENVIKRVLAVQNEWVVLYPDQQYDDIRRIQVRRRLLERTFSCAYFEFG